MNLPSKTILSTGLSLLLLTTALLPGCRKNDSNNGGTDPVGPGVPATEVATHYIFSVIYQDTILSDIPGNPPGLQGYQTHIVLTVYDRQYNKLWNKDFTGLNFTGMMLAKGTLMVPSAKSLYAIDLQTGEYRWKKENTVGYFLQPVNRGDTLYYTHVDKIAALEAANVSTGELYWQVPLADVNDYSGNGMLKDSIYFFQSANVVCSHMNAFNLNTRKLLWQTAGCITSSSYTNLIGNDIYLLHQNYLSPETSTMISINAANGAINWNRTGAAVYVAAPQCRHTDH